MKEQLKVLNKIVKAKEIIRNSPVKKEGRNTYSNYDYYTPEQISNLVYDACKEVGLITMFGTQRDDNGLFATLTIVDLDSGESVVYTQVTDIPAIKATNVAQQLGGMNTYSNRYLLMFVFDIVDNNLDPDTTENTKKTATAVKKESAPKKEEPKANDDRSVLTDKHDKWDDLVEYLKNGGKIDAIRKKYKFTKNVEEQLNKQAGK